MDIKELKDKAQNSWEGSGKYEEYFHEVGFIKGYAQGETDTEEKILNWLKKRFSEHAPIEFIIREFEKKDYKNGR